VLIPLQVFALSDLSLITVVRCFFQWAADNISGKGEKKAFPIKQFLSALVFAVITSAIVYFLFADKIKDMFPNIFPAQVSTRISSSEYARKLTPYIYTGDCTYHGRVVCRGSNKCAVQSKQE
jgi:hypothetical protein